MPSCKAERGGEQGRVVTIEERHQRERGTGIGSDVRDCREARRIAVKAQEQRGIGDLCPRETAVPVEFRQTFEPLELTRTRSRSNGADGAFIAAQMISTVQPGAGEERFRPQVGHGD